MGSSVAVSLLVIAFIYSIIVIILYISKGHIKTEETRIFSVLMMTNFVGIIVELLCISFIKTFGVNSILTILINRLFLTYHLFFTMEYFIYTMVVIFSKDSDKKKEKQTKTIVYIITSIFAIAALLPMVPLEIVDNEIGCYSSGLATTIVYTYASLSVAVMVIMLIINRKKIADNLNRIIPLFTFIIGGIIVSIIQRYNPAFTFSTEMEALLVFLMFHTIENPDLKMIEELEIARDQAEKANHAKTDFLSSMSHEIRTPLNAIVGLSEDIGSFKDEVPPQVKEDAEDIIDASQTLLEIVGNILDISKIESEKLEIIDVDYDPKETFETLAKINLTRKGEKPIDFKMDIAADLPYTLIGDKIRVKQIVNNLLSNSFKYTNQGEINFTVKCINENGMCNLMITVQDTGIGIKKEYIDKLFHKFERLDVERNTTVEGTGLGLAITKKLVEMMGGKINVQSTYGAGSMFFVQLPQKIKAMTAPAPTPAATPVTAQAVAPAPQVATVPQAAPTVEQVPQVIQAPVAPPPTDDKYAGKKVLIVDDNALNIKVAKRALSSFNFVLDECSSGEESIEKVKQANNYDLILMDIMMPGIGGETALQELKKIEGFATPVIALTADAISGAKEHYMEAGFNDYIAKPFSRDQIKEKIDAIFK